MNDRKPDASPSPLIEYQHKDDAYPSSPWFRQYEKDKLPVWAVNVRPAMSLPSETELTMSHFASKEDYWKARAESAERDLAEAQKWRGVMTDIADAAQRRAESAERREQEALKDAERYKKLRGWMSSNVKEGWREVENLAAVACYAGWGDFDAQLDDMAQCAVGLMAPTAIDAAKEKP